MTAVLLIAGDDGNARTLVNVEELDPDPFMALMPAVGIGWNVRDT